MQPCAVFCEPVGIKVTEVAQDKRTGSIDLSDLKKKLSSRTAGMYLEYPSFLGFVEEAVDEIGSMVHQAEALLVVGSEPISLGVLKPPGEFNADIVVGEGQPLGNHMNYGGPLLGIFACRGDATAPADARTNNRKDHYAGRETRRLLHGLANSRTTYQESESNLQHLYKRGTARASCCNVPVSTWP